MSLSLWLEFQHKGLVMDRIIFPTSYPNRTLFLVLIIIKSDTGEIYPQSVWEPLAEPQQKSRNTVLESLT